MSNRPPKPNVTGRPGLFLQNKLDLLELLLADPGLGALRVRSPLHPAVKRYDNIAAFLAKRIGLSYPDETNLVLDIGSILLDAFLPDSSVTLDDVLRSMGDDEVFQQLRKRVADPNQIPRSDGRHHCLEFATRSGLGTEISRKGRTA